MREGVREVFTLEAFNSGHALSASQPCIGFVPPLLQPSSATLCCSGALRQSAPCVETGGPDATAHLAHEVRSLVGATLGALQMVAEGATALQRLLWVEKLPAQFKALLAFVDSLLVGGRMCAAEQVTRASIELLFLVRTPAFELEVLAVQKGLTLDVDVSPSTLGLTLTTDRTAVSQIVRNLLANAINFTMSGSIRRSARALGGWIEIVVTDTGSGMTRSQARSLFRPYAGNNAAESGWCPGLWVSAELASSLGGTLDAQSTQGIGTRVALRLPNGAAPSSP